MAKTIKPKKDAAVTTSGGVNLAEIEMLLDFMKKHDLAEFEYEREGVHVLLKKTSASATGAPRPVHNAEEAAPAPPIAAAPAASAAPPPEPAASKPPAANVHQVKSPIVGTFYSSPNPDADSFVKIGDQVEAGQVLCIIEAMKLMNEIESDVAGEIAEIYMENGHPVEYGEPLFGIRAKGKK